MGGSFNPVAASNEFADECAHSPRRELNMLWDAEAASAARRRWSTWRPATAPTTAAR